MKEWAKPRCESFNEKSCYTSELSLDQQQLYTEFCSLMESLISNYLDSNSIASADFYRAIREEHEELIQRSKKKRHPLPSFASALIAVTDFESFYDLMHDVYRGNRVVFCPPLISVMDSLMEDYDDDCKSSTSAIATEEKGDKYSQDKMEKYPSHK